MAKIKFIKSIRGKNVLIYDLYLYNYANMFHCRSYWYCTQKRVSGCSASVCLMNYESIHSTSGYHNHGPEEKKIASAEFTENFKRYAQKFSLKPLPQLYKEHLIASATTEEIAELLPDYNSIRSSLYKIKNSFLNKEKKVLDAEEIERRRIREENSRRHKVPSETTKRNILATIFKKPKQASSLHSDKQLISINNVVSVTDVPTTNTSDLLKNRSTITNTTCLQSASHGLKSIAPSPKDCLPYTAIGHEIITPDFPNISTAGLQTVAPKSYNSKPVSKITNTINLPTTVMAGLQSITSDIHSTLPTLKSPIPDLQLGLQPATSNLLSATRGFQSTTSSFQSTTPSLQSTTPSLQSTTPILLPARTNLVSELSITPDFPNFSKDGLQTVAPKSQNSKPVSKITDTPNLPLFNSFLSTVKFPIPDLQPAISGLQPATSCLQSATLGLQSTTSGLQSSTPSLRPASSNLDSELSTESDLESPIILKQEVIETVEDQTNDFEDSLFFKSSTSNSKDPISHSQNITSKLKNSAYCQPSGSRFTQFSENTLIPTKYYFESQNQNTKATMVAQMNCLSKDISPDRCDSCGLKRSRDISDAYGELVAKKLRSLDCKSRAYVQKTISDLFFEAEMGLFLTPEEKAKFGKKSESIVNGLHETISNTSTINH